MQADPIPWSNTSFSSLATQTTFLRDMLAKWVKKAQIPLPSDSTSSSNDLRVAEQSVAQEPNPPSPSTPLQAGKGKTSREKKRKDAESSSPSPKKSTRSSSLQVPFFVLFFHACGAELSLAVVTITVTITVTVTNTFRQKWDPSTGKYHTVKLMGTLEELDHVDNWYTRLLGYTRQALKDRFPEDEIVTAASLFDRRTWPKEPKDLSKDDRLPALQKLSSTFPAIKQFSEKQFVSAACAVAAMVPPLVSSRGRIRAHDCTHCWAIASQASWATSHLPVVRAATVLCTIAQSQSSTERMNSMLKLAAGGRRWRLTGQGLADEVLIRTVGPSLPDAEDLIHRAVVQWSIAAERRPQSYEDSSESDSDEMGTSDSDTSFATGSSISSGEEGSMSSRSAASADDDEEPLPQPEPAEPQQPEQAEEDVQQDAPQDAAPDFLSWLSKYRPQLAAYEIRLRRDGWDTVQSLKLLTVEDMAQLNILPGHRRLLVDTVKDL